ncbi:MAG TPA: lytic murein transglycosylase B [Pararobbsia sp.]|nr:lytic murein transglycosylase B [Pararobbsia sp.]
MAAPIALTAGLALASATAFAQDPAQQTFPGQSGTPGQTFEEEIVPQRYANNPDVDAFINDMVARYDFDADALHQLFDQVSYSATAVKLVTPAPAPGVKNWQVYRSRFVEPIRINAGVKFWRENRDALQRASAQYGVPPETIVGIIGVETIYGKYMGNFRVLDALTTLSFDYPATPNQAEREQTFRRNLADLLIWTRDSGIDPTTVQGSYAGAIGIPQFMPSSIVQYAVNFDGNKTIDLRNSPTDAIGSVANYLNKNGWERGRPVEWRIAGDAGSVGIAQAANDGSPDPKWTLGQLLTAGMLLNQPGLDPAAEGQTMLTSVDLPSPAAPTQYVLGLKNFYVLTRYNRSFFYAQAVYDLGEAVKAKLSALDAADAARANSNPGGGAGVSVPANGGGMPAPGNQDGDSN